MKYRVISVMLAVLIAFTFGVNSFQVRASAVVPELIVAVSYVGFGITASVFAAMAGNDLVNAINAAGKDAEVNRILNDGVLCVYNGENGPYFAYQDNDNYTDFERQIQQSICDQLNSNYSGTDILNSIHYNAGTGSFELKSSVYSDMKAASANACIQALHNRLENLNVGSLPRPHQFTFDLTEGISSTTAPEVNIPQEFTTEGFYFLPTYIHPKCYNEWTESETNARAWTNNAPYWQLMTVDDGRCATVYRNSLQTRDNTYGMGWCVIYNGKCYFVPILSKQSSPISGGRNVCFNVITHSTTSFVSSDGESLSTAGCTSYEGLPYCPYFIIDPDVEYNYPRAVSSDQFYNTTGGTKNIDMTDQEDLIKSAIKNGIIDKDPELTIGADGTIEAADGISLETLAQLLEGIYDNQIDSKDLMSALNMIKGILQSLKVSNDSIDQVLSNYAKYWKDAADDLDDINNSVGVLPDIKSGVDDMSDDLSDIKDNVQSIADSIAEAKEAEYSNQRRDFDLYVINHTGLQEAQDIVDDIPIVQQIKVLFDMAFHNNVYSSSAPSFRFYMDWDKDGVQETYNALDLSFLDQRLTNTNLEDKSRFRDSPTIREFIQGIIILVCYFAFAIKIIKKLPGLVGGSSDSDSGLKSSDKESGLDD